MASQDPGGMHDKVNNNHDFCSVGWRVYWIAYMDVVLQLNGAHVTVLQKMKGVVGAVGIGTCGPQVSTMVVSPQHDLLMQP